MNAKFLPHKDYDYLPLSPLYLSRASIEKYLLEKSRIISQSPGERNYHVFYYLLTGADSDLKRKLRLLDINEYNYLTQVSVSYECVQVCVCVYMYMYVYVQVCACVQTCM